MTCIFLFWLFYPKKPVESPKTLSEMDTIVNALTFDEKVGQCIMVSLSDEYISTETATLISSLHPGGILITGTHTIDGLTKMVKNIKNLELKIPPFIAIDEEGGPVRRIIEDNNPGPRILSQDSDTAVCRYTKNTSELLHSIGINTNFGLVADIAWHPQNYIANRSYGSNPQKVSLYVEKYIDCAKPILTIAKHFPGHGRTDLDSHTHIPQTDISLATWEKTDLVPFKAAIEKYVDFIMIGHLIYSDIASEPASLSPYYTQKIHSLGYYGLTITDDLSMLFKQGKNVQQTIEAALIAGSDMLLFVAKPEDAFSYVNTVKDDIKNGVISEEELHTRLKRILQKKRDKLSW